VTPSTDTRVSAVNAELFEALEQLEQATGREIIKGRKSYRRITVKEIS
jgi:hypothetical protein